MDRRNFIKKSMVGGLSAGIGISGLSSFAFPFGDEKLSRVALTTGSERADMAFRALLPFSEQIKRDIGNRRVVLKPNLVQLKRQLATTHVGTLEGILEFLKSIKKLENVVIAESSAAGPAMNGYEHFNYLPLASKYPVKFLDLDLEGFEIVHVVNQKDIMPHKVRVSKLMIDPDNYIVSVAKMKTHNTVVATLSLKNIVFGAPIKDTGFRHGADRAPGAVNDKQIVHGGGTHGINYNMFSLSDRLHPHLAVIDGFESMEGNGPNNGDAVDHRICVASTDWLAADRVGVETMGIDFNDIGYLNYCAKANMGVADLNKIEIVGEKVSDHIMKYRLPDNIEKQMSWKSPLS